ncbi:MAG TPA: hypothetical protein VHE30_05865 [Polyangiaceae bacterium]|nr:hypothetical protein [Polyangiaceae bacterium]
MRKKTAFGVATGALAALCVVAPASAQSGLPWVTRVADFFHAESPTPSARPTTTAVAAFPDVAPEKSKAAPDPAAELLETSPYGAQLAAAQARENLFGPDLDHLDPYAEELSLANPYSEDLHLVNPYASPGRVPQAVRPPGFDNPYTAERIAVTHPAEPDLSNPYSRR